MSGLLSLLPLAGFLLGILTTASGLLVYYRNSAIKRYAAERDFQHLKRNQEQLLENLVVVLDAVEDLTVEVVRIEARLK